MDRLFDASLRWNGPRPAEAEIEFYRLDSTMGPDPVQYLTMVEITTAWMRPQHLRFGSISYSRNDHPLDRQRNGIGWIGWLPFSLTPADVPEAHLIAPMNGGTVVMTWPEFWQAHPGARNEDAVRRTQDVEIRLNSLGVLPTNADLAGGMWGR